MTFFTPHGNNIGHIYVKMYLRFFCFPLQDFPEDIRFLNTDVYAHRQNTPDGRVTTNEILC